MRTANVVDGRRVKVKTHLRTRWVSLVGAGEFDGPLCNQTGGRRWTDNPDRVDCLRCLANPRAQRRSPGPQAMRRIVRDEDIVESPIIQYRSDLGEFIYIGPLFEAFTHIRDRSWWVDLSPDGRWLYALCPDEPGEVFAEYGFGSSFDEAQRVAIAAYLGKDRDLEWRLCEEVMW